MKRHLFKKSDVIFHEGSKGNCAFMIEKGRVAIFSGDKNNTPRLLAILNKNDIFGEMGLIDNQPRSATAVALEDCELTLIREKTVRHLLKNDPFALRPLLRVLSKRLRETTRQLYKP